MLHPTSFGMRLATQYKVFRCQRRWVSEKVKASNQYVRADKSACGTLPQAEELALLEGMLCCIVVLILL